MKKTNMNDCWWIDVRKWMLVGLLCMISVMGYTKPNKLDSLSVRVANVENSITRERQEISILQKEVEVCEKSLRNIDEHVDRANEKVSNQITSSSHTIQAWGWIMTVLAFVFGYYINRMWKKVADATANAEKQLHRAEEASADIAEEQERVNAQQQAVKKMQEDTEVKLQELQTLHSDIQNNMSAIYEKMKREETMSWLNRLENIPEDIANVGDILLARQLIKSDFQIMLNAYHNLIKRCMEVNEVTTIAKLRQKDAGFRKREGSYALQFAQHFMDEAIVVEETRDILRPRFGVYFEECFFRNDAEKCTADLKKGVARLEEGLQVEIIAEYVLAMAKSHYSKFEELYSTLLSDLAENNIRKIWEKISADKKDAIHLAQYLKKLIEERKFSAEFLANVDAYLQKAVSVKAG